MLDQPTLDGPTGMYYEQLLALIDDGEKVTLKEDNRDSPQNPSTYAYRFWEYEVARIGELVTCRVLSIDKDRHLTARLTEIRLEWGSFWKRSTSISPPWYPTSVRDYACEVEVLGSETPNEKLAELVQKTLGGYKFTREETTVDDFEAKSLLESCLRILKKRQAAG